MEKEIEEKRRKEEEIEFEKGKERRKHTNHCTQQMKDR